VTAPPFFVQSALLREVPGVYHAFLGADPVPGRSDSELLSRVFCVPSRRVAFPRQVHSALVHRVASEEAGEKEEDPLEGDALWTDVPGAGVGVRTADCVPVLIALPGVPAVAAVHAGWRGLAAGILDAAVRALAGRFGEDAPRRLVAAAGPCARGCCYEVGDDVAERLSRLPGGGRFVRRRGPGGPWTADLQALAVEGLAAAGLAPARVEGAGPCTVCSPRFRSFRRERTLTGHQASFIYIL